MGDFMKSALVFSLFAVAFSLSAPGAHAQERTRFTLAGMWKGALSTERCWENLCVNIYVKRTEVSSGKVEICAQFTNEYSETTWKGAYRLTNRDDPTVFSSLTVPGQETRERCEILPALRDYWVVLREDGKRD